MAPTESRTVLITGANAGIGKEVARQLGRRDETAKIYLACRNPSRAQAAKTELEAATGRSIFEVLIMDVSDVHSVRAVVPTIDGTVDALIMNAGGSGGDTPMALTKAGATTIFAANVLGHVALLDALLDEDRLSETAVFAGSEAARGIPKLRMKRPEFRSNSVEEFASVIDGTWFAGGKASSALAYGQVKYIGALWMSSTARRHPDVGSSPSAPATRPEPTARTACRCRCGWPPSTSCPSSDRGWGSPTLCRPARGGSWTQ